MSYTAFEACLESERRRCGHGDLATLLALAAHVNQKDVDRGWDWEAWPSQTTLAAELGLDPRQLRRHLSALKECGDICETGEHKGRGVKVYRITLPPRAEVSTVDMEDQGSDSSTLDISDRSSTSTVVRFDRGDDGDDPGHIRPPDRSDVTTRPDISGRDPGHMCPTEPGEPEDEPEWNADLARAEARESGLSPSTRGPVSPTTAQLAAERAEDEAELAALEAQRETTAHPGTTERSIADIRRRLGAPQEIAA